MTHLLDRVQYYSRKVRQRQGSFCATRTSIETDKYAVVLVALMLNKPDVSHAHGKTTEIVEYLLGLSCVCQLCPALSPSRPELRRLRTE
jgi:hypothetical protein